MTTRDAYYNEGTSYNVPVPSIYAVEFASYCTLKCRFCPRGQYPDTYIDFELARTISERDLSGSRWIEFQQTGEPTLHKQFNELVQLFKGKVLIGTSTHGNTMEKCITGLLMLDFITVSIDSVTNYEQVRKGGRWTKLQKNLHMLLEAKGSNPFPKIDLQLIEFPDYKLQVKLLEELTDLWGWHDRVTIRTVPESFSGMYGGVPIKPKRELCTNPWVSVNVQADGDVVPCCLMFSKDIVYGNLKQQSLEEIWQTSPVLQKFRDQHRSDNLPHPCKSCFMRSPWMLHDDLLWNSIKDEVLRR